MDSNTVNLIAIVGGWVTLLGVMITMFLWMRSEASSDRRDIHAVQREDRKELLTIMRSIQDEIKDFHDRLCMIEQARK